AVSPLEDPDDELDLNLWNSCATHNDIDGFKEKIWSLVFDTCFNLHQITLADSLILLQQQYPEHTAELIMVAKYHTRKCAEMSS
ncbi:hypothetical protein ACW5XI_13415, partial [Aeromonas australiensis]